jgi:uncharacterized membrane protein
VADAVPALHGAALRSPHPFDYKLSFTIVAKIIGIDRWNRSPKEKFAMNGEARTPQSHVIAALSYLLGFITGLIFLYVEPYNQDEFVRFHARQSIGFSVAWFAISVILGVFIAVLPQFLSVILSFLLDIIDIALAVYWIFLMYKAYIGERYRIPELADIVDSIAGSPAV